MKNFSRHARFMLAFALGGGVALLAGIWQIGRPVQALFGADSFFLAYLAMTLRLAMTTKSDELKRYAAADDEGIVVIVVLAVGTVCVSFAAIIWVLNSPETGAWHAALALAAVPLGWGMVHTVASFRYAHLYYSEKSGAGLVFPGNAKPDVWDFLYFSFGIGMTAQVSDVVVTAPGIRKLVLGHAIGAFFYNTVILALAVNAGLALGHA